MAASQELRITALSTMSVFPTIEIVFCACYLLLFFKGGDPRNGEKIGKEGEAAFAVINQESQRTRRDF